MGAWPLPQSSRTASTTSPSVRKWPSTPSPFASSSTLASSAGAQEIKNMQAQIKAQQVELAALKASTLQPVSPPRPRTLTYAVEDIMISESPVDTPTARSPLIEAGT